MSAGRHHRVTQPEPTEYAEAWRAARRQRRIAREANEVTIHARISAPEAWAAMTDEARRGYNGGWGSRL